VLYMLPDNPKIRKVIINSLFERPKLVSEQNPAAVPQASTPKH